MMLNNYARRLGRRFMGRLTLPLATGALLAAILVVAMLPVGRRVATGATGGAGRWVARWTEATYPANFNAQTGGGHTRIDWSRPDAPYSRPIGLSVTAPEWLQPAIYRVVAHDLRMILPHSPVDPIAPPRPGAPLLAPIVAVNVHRADRRWRPFTGTVILQATAIAADAPPSTIWPADAFSPSRQNMLAIHGDGVVTAEASVSAVLTRAGFEWPDAVADRLAQRISRALIAELVEQLQPPDDPSSDNAGASASARPAPAPDLHASASVNPHRRNAAARRSDDGGKSRRLDRRDDLQWRAGPATAVLWIERLGRRVCGRLQARRRV